MPDTRLRIAAASVTGPGRQWNEDQCAVFDLAGPAHVGRAALTVPRDPGACLLVLDGMGGHSTGGLACDLALRTLTPLLRDPPPGEPRPAWLERALRAAFDAVSGANARRELFAGATATLALVEGDALHFAHIGETRAYRLRDGALEQLTRDDTLEREARDAGLPAAQLAELPRGIITRCLGYGEFTAHTGTCELRDGDLVVLTTDGLHGLLDAATIAAHLDLHLDLERACDVLIAAAIQAGSSDNITVLLARLEAPTPLA